ncbi:hypothetical protein D3C86_1230450 [compost metagenome]
MKVAQRPELLVVDGTLARGRHAQDLAPAIRGLLLPTFEPLRKPLQVQGLGMLLGPERRQGFEAPKQSLEVRQVLGGGGHLGQPDQQIRRRALVGLAQGERLAITAEGLEELPRRVEGVPLQLEQVGLCRAHRRRDPLQELGEGGFAGGAQQASCMGAEPPLHLRPEAVRLGLLEQHVGRRTPGAAQPGGVVRRHVRQVAAHELEPLGRRGRRFGEREGEGFGHQGGGQGVQVIGLGGLMPVGRVGFQAEDAGALQRRQPVARGHGDGPCPREVPQQREKLGQGLGAFQQVQVVDEQACVGRGLGQGDREARPPRGREARAGQLLVASTGFRPPQQQPVQQEIGHAIFDAQAKKKRRQGAFKLPAAQERRFAGSRPGAQQDRPARVKGGHVHGIGSY